MGVYADRGVEYHVVMDDGARVVIAATKDTDVRLLVSEFYRARRATWFGAHTTRPFCRAIDAGQALDVRLTDDERARLAAALEPPHQPVRSVREHGWFDVNVMSSSSSSSS